MINLLKFLEFLIIPFLGLDLCCYLQGIEKKIALNLQIKWSQADSNR